MFVLQAVYSVLQYVRCYGFLSLVLVSANPRSRAYHPARTAALKEGKSQVEANLIGRAAGNKALEKAREAGLVTEG